MQKCLVRIENVGNVRRYKAFAWLVTDWKIGALAKDTYKTGPKNPHIFPPRLTRNKVVMVKLISINICMCADWLYYYNSYINITLFRPIDPKLVFIS